MTTPMACNSRGTGGEILISHLLEVGGECWTQSLAKQIVSLSCRVTQCIASHYDTVTGNRAWTGRFTN